MAYLLLLLSAYQFILRLADAQNTPFYLVLNSYVFLMPFVVAWIASVTLLRRSVDKNLLIGWVFILIFPSVILPTYIEAPDFVFLFLRGLQFFWGPALLIPALLGLFRMVGFADASPETGRRYIWTLTIIAASLTIFEVIAVKIAGISPLAFPWVSHDPRAQDINPFRPWGLLSYPEPNALILAYLFWLSYLYSVRGLWHRIAAFVAVAISLVGTGQLGWLVLLPLALRRPFVGAGLGMLPFAVVVAAATYTGQWQAQGVLARFDLTYASLLLRTFTIVLQRYLEQFSGTELLFGSHSPSIDAMIGLTHDWAYIDVFYVYGLVGTMGYILLYAAVLYIACPRESTVSKRIYFMLAGLALNFHYGTLNYYLGQFIFSSLAALQLQRAFVEGRVAIIRQSRTRTATAALS